MKKIIAMVLLTTILLGLAACGTVNKSEVSIIWSDLEYDKENSIIMVPNSLINAVERAMYIENISYAHYDGDSDSAKQTQLAQEALDKGCAAIMVQLADTASAQAFIDLAKAKNVPVVFFGCDVEESVAAGYDKCAVIKTDAASVSKVQGEMIGSAITEKKAMETLDTNGDGKLTYMAIGDVSEAVENANTVLQEAGIAALEAVEAASVEELDVTSIEKKKTEYGVLTAADGNAVELIIADNDQAVLEAVVALQAKGFNKEKLTTHFVGIFAVGSDADYKSHVLSGKPEGEEAVKAYYEEQRYLVDLTAVKDEEIDVMVYNTMNVIDAGQILNTAMEDYDALAEQAAAIMAQLLKGKAVETAYIAVPYKAYA